MARAWKVRLVGSAMALLIAPAAESGGPSQKEVLARAGRRVVQYQAELPHLIATETSVQLARAPAGRLLEIQERHLVSELGWVSAGTLPDLVGVRDVVEVDGQPLPAMERLAVDFDHVSHAYQVGERSGADPSQLRDQVAFLRLDEAASRRRGQLHRCLGGNQVGEFRLILDHAASGARQDVLLAGPAAVGSHGQDDQGYHANDGACSPPARRHRFHATVQTPD